MNADRGIDAPVVARNRRLSRRRPLRSVTAKKPA